MQVTSLALPGQQADGFLLDGETLRNLSPEARQVFQEVGGYPFQDREYSLGGWRILSGTGVFVQDEESAPRARRQS